MVRAEDYNCYIVRRGKEYLQARDENTGRIIWSQYIFDSCPIRDLKDAGTLARRYCGHVLEFNHATGKYS